MGPSANNAGANNQAAQPRLTEPGNQMAPLLPQEGPPRDFLQAIGGPLR